MNQQTQSRGEDPRGTTTPPARLHRLTKRYGHSPALCNVDMTIGAGELVALLGPNGAGKTTLVRLLLGLTRPSEGAVEVFGRDPRDPAARRRLGAMHQSARVPEMLRVVEHIRLFSSYYPAPLPLTNVLETAGLLGLERRFFG